MRVCPHFPEEEKMIDTWLLLSLKNFIVLVAVLMAVVGGVGMFARVAWHILQKERLDISALELGRDLKYFRLAIGGIAILLIMAQLQ